MNLTYKDLLIRDATVEDAEQLCTWWNDGKVMEHAGFPNGLGITANEIRKQLLNNETGKLPKNQRHIIFCETTPLGEMNYREINVNTCEIGIKICDFSMQNKGLGKIILSLFIDTLFNKLGYSKIILDTDINNRRAQHVYEELGFKKTQINKDSWKGQLGNWRSSVDYELTKESFLSFL